MQLSPFNSPQELEGKKSLIERLKIQSVFLNWKNNICQLLIQPKTGANFFNSVHVLYSFFKRFLNFLPYL